MLYSDNAPLLQMEFSQETIRVFEPKSIRFKCTCNIAKMENSIRLLGEKEANEILKEKREVVVTCEYCNYQYIFDKATVDALFNSPHAQ